MRDRDPAPAPQRAPLLMPPLLGRLLTPELQAVARRLGHNRIVRKGEAIVRPGELVDALHFFHAGWYALVIGGSVANIYGPHEVHTLALEASPTRSPALLRALSPGSIAVVPRAFVRQALLGSPELALFVANQSIHALARARIFHARRNTDPLDVRLAHVLWSLAERRDDGMRRVIPELPQAEIASLLGVTREEVSRKRQLLVKAGYLFERGGEWFMDAGTPLMLASQGYELAADIWYRGPSLHRADGRHAPAPTRMP